MLKRCLRMDERIIMFLNALARLIQMLHKEFCPVVTKQNTLSTQPIAFSLQATNLINIKILYLREFDFV